MTVVVLSGEIVCAGPDPQDEQVSDEEKKGDEEPGPIEGLQEPPQIKDESEGIDPTNKDALAWYMSGQKALKRGDLEAAEEAFQKAAEADPKSAIPLRALAIVLFRMNKGQEGLEKAQQAIDLDADDFQTRLELAVLYARNNRIPEAAQYVRDALASTRLDPTSVEYLRAHQVRAAISLQTRNVSDAADSYEVILKAIEHPEQFSLTEKEHAALLKDRLTNYETTGRVLLEAGRVAKAIEAFEGLSQRENGKAGDHNLLLARAYFQQDKQSECEKNLNIYFGTGRRSKDALMLLRDLYEASERNDALVPRLRELVTDSADATLVRMFLGDTLLTKGLADEAATELQAILDESGEPEAYVGLARVEIARKNSKGFLQTLTKASKARMTLEEMMPLVSSLAGVDEFAKETLKTCLELYESAPDELHANATYLCALVAKEAEMPVEEGQLLKATLELDPDRTLMVRTLEQSGMNSLQQQEFEKAARSFEKILAMPQITPYERLNTLFRISLAYGAIDDLKAARRALTEALRMVPDEPQLLSRLAQIEATDGDLPKAARLLERAIEKSAENAAQRNESRLLLASVYAQQRKWNESAEQYEFILDTEQLSPDMLRSAKMGLSNAYVQGGDMEKGEKVLEEVYEIDPQDPGINNDLGYLYADQGKKLEQALQMIQIAVAAVPTNPAYLDSLGWVLHKLGRNEEALEQIRKANSDPEYEDATLLEHQGDVEMALEKKEDAVASWQKALTVEKKARQSDQKVVDRVTEKLKSAGAEPKPGDDASKEELKADGQGKDGDQKE
ncbi:MAG: tetratricopeptide repeat protein [Planctomycetota bacterium]